MAQHGSGAHLEQTSIAGDSVLQNSTQSGPPSRRRVDNLLGVHYPRTNKKKAIFISENVEFIAKKTTKVEENVSYIGKLYKLNENISTMNLCILNTASNIQGQKV